MGIRALPKLFLLNYYCSSRYSYNGMGAGSEGSMLLNVEVGLHRHSTPKFVRDNRMTLDGLLRYYVITITYHI